MIHMQRVDVSDNMAGPTFIASDGAWGEYDGAATIISKDWTHLSVNSDDIKHAASPFDDIGYLATGTVPSRSFNMKGSNVPVENPTPEVSNQCTKATGGKQQNATTTNHNYQGSPSLNDFFQREKNPLTPQQKQLNQEIISKASSKFPFRRGQLFKGASRRGDIGNIADEVSIGISTIASMGLTKRTVRGFEISKGSLTLSKLGASKSSNNKYHDSKSRGTKTTVASTHTKSTVSVFGTSMFSRDSSNTKERLRETIDQLDGANHTLMNENQELKVRLHHLNESLAHASLYEVWLSVQELAEQQTETCKLRAICERADMDRKRLEKKVKSLIETVEAKEIEILDLKTVKQAQSDRIAHLEAKLLENQIDPTHHHQLVNCDNQMVMSMDSSASFGSFGSLDDFCAEQDDDIDRSSYEANMNSCKEAALPDPNECDCNVHQLITEGRKIDLPIPPPPPPSRRCLTDPCNSFRKKLASESKVHRSKSPGTRRKAKESLAFVASNHTKSSKCISCGPVISTSRVTENPRRARTTSTGTSAISTYEKQKRDNARARRAKSLSNHGGDYCDRKAPPTTPSCQSSRRRLRKSSSIDDSMDNSQHSTKSNKSAKSVKSAKSSGTARRRANGNKSIDSLGPGSNHSTRSAARRRLRNTIMAEKDRGTVREALNRFAGDDDNALQASLGVVGSSHPTSASMSTPIKRSSTGNFKELVPCKPMTLVQDHARKTPSGPYLRPVSSGG